MKYIKKYPGLIILGIFFFYIAVITFLYPLMNDDFCYAANSNISQLINSYFQSYLHWNPRLGILVAMIFSSLPKFYFNIFNPTIQIINIILIFYLIFQRFPIKHKIKDGIYLLFICSFYLLFTAQPGQTIVWITGSAINSWMLLLWLVMLSMMIPMTKFKNYLFNTKKGLAVSLILGFFVGMSNYNNSVINILIMIAYISYLKLKRMTIPRYINYLILGSVIGAFSLFVAPGNYERLNHPELRQFTQIDIFYRILIHPIIHILTLAYESKYLSVIIIVIILIISIEELLSKSTVKDISNKYLIKRAFIYIIISYLLAVSFSPLFPVANRAYFSSTIFILMAAIIIIRLITNNLQATKTTILIALIVIGLDLYLLFPITRDYYSLYYQDQKRQIQIYNARINNKKELVVKGYKIKYSRYIYIFDITNYHKFYINQCASIIYGFNKITSKNAY